MQYSYTIEYDPKIDPYQPKVEVFHEDGDSIFQNVYNQALTQIDLILQSGQSNASNIIDEFDYRNIVAFAGERGAGKTSAMMSVAKTLEKSSSLPNGFSFKNNRFLILPPINPAHITEQETILDIILASLYNKFESNMKDPMLSYASSLEEKQSLYRNFEKIHSIIQKQCSNREKIYGEPELFQNTAAGTTLKSNLYNLITEYLKLMQYNKLVLQIDDIDLNLEHAYSICEDLRKYFSIPNVVILFAINLNQLYALMEQHYYKALDTLYSHGNKAYIQERVPQMAEQYLRKLIPSSRRCVLPELKLTMQKHINLRILQNGTEPERTESLLKILMSTIYAKTGVILVAKNEEHPLLPDTLRGLWHLMTLLEDMADVPLIDDSGNPIYYQQNSDLSKQLDLLESYFMDGVVHRLRIEERELFESFYGVPNTILNKYIVRKVYTLLQNEIKLGVLECPEIENIKLLSNIPEPGNISCGDVLYTLSVYEKTIPERVVFPALIRLFYSIRSIRARHLDKQHGRQELFNLLRGSIISLTFNKIISNDILCTLSVHKDDFKNATQELSDVELTKEECSDLHICQKSVQPIRDMCKTIYESLVVRDYPSSLFALGKINEVYNGATRSRRSVAQIQKAESNEANESNESKKNLNTIISFGVYFKELEDPYYDTRLSTDCSIGNNTFLYFSGALPMALVYHLLNIEDSPDIIPLCSMDVLQYFSSKCRSETDKKDKYTVTDQDRVDAFEKAIKSIMTECCKYSYLNDYVLGPNFNSSWENAKTFTRLLHIIKLVPSINMKRQGALHKSSNKRLDSVSSKINDRFDRDICRKSIKNAHSRYLNMIKRIVKLFESRPFESDAEFTIKGKEILYHLENMQGITLPNNISPQLASLLQNESKEFRAQIMDLCKEVHKDESIHGLTLYLHQMEDVLHMTVNRLEELMRRL